MGNILAFYGRVVIAKLEFRHYIEIMQQINESLSPETPALTPADAPPFAATDAAMARIAKILIGEPAGSAFVVEVQGGGCSGFQYHFDLKIPAIHQDDLVLEQNGAKLVVDATSLDLLKGSTLDYTEDLAKSGFELKNPNATMKCGCGNSFSI